MGQEALGSALCVSQPGGLRLKVATRLSPTRREYWSLAHSLRLELSGPGCAVFLGAPGKEAACIFEARKQVVTSQGLSLSLEESKEGVSQVQRTFWQLGSVDCTLTNGSTGVQNPYALLQPDS